MTNENIAPEHSEQVVANLSLQDLAAVVQVIDLCSQRGAFQGAELEVVGGLRGRIQAFVAANTPNGENDEEESEDE